ncbi:hypothetical protein [Coxiella-like endosymbiont]|uniref:hypothetical protein n=1 Tax=Coxiella-like endosymbiont TaxID=1592897 RepID=UPI002729888E|nr:hypothetical protein [Coxiella-like endosymbiont]
MGDVTRKQAESISQEIIGSLLIGQSTEPLVPDQANIVAKYQYIIVLLEQNTILIGQIRIGLTNPYYFPPSGWKSNIRRIVFILDFV